MEEWTVIPNRATRNEESPIEVRNMEEWTAIPNRATRNEEFQLEYFNFNQIIYLK
jgi:hypothetical protein